MYVSVCMCECMRVSVIVCKCLWLCLSVCMFVVLESARKNA